MDAQTCSRADCSVLVTVLSHNRGNELRLCVERTQASTSESNDLCLHGDRHGGFRYRREFPGNEDSFVLGAFAR